MDLQNTILAKLTASIPAPPMRLRDLIRQIRAARTAADERAVIQKECAYIRSTFREEDNVWRCRNVAKLLYIHMLGYPAHFGQLECLKLIASGRFTDKRIGYLGAMLLLDERQDVHLLITNSLKNDLNSQTQFVVGLALCALGSICSPEMSRDLAGEVERLMKSNNTYIRKKAALCASRIIRKVPELLEMFLPAARALINDKNHAVLITGITLVTDMCERSPDTLLYFKKANEMVPNLVRILKNLIMSGYSPEHDVCGVSDPFLQVKILRLLRILGHNDEEASEQMNDILAQVATNTESTKNVGNAILYETVITIMAIRSESSLRVLAVNILGRFLLNTDKNIRYVALTTLLKTVQADYDAVQRHRNTIVDCLKDPDVSIRKKAMELCFALINASNIKSISKELIYFLEKADPEFKSICSSNLCICAEKFAPNTRWQIDTMIRVLTTSGNYVRDDVVGNLIQLISSATSLNAYAVQQLWAQMATENLDTKQPLLQVAMWTLGEFADLLNVPYVDPNSVDGDPIAPAMVSELKVIELFEQVLNTTHMNIVTKEYTIEALMKLSVRFPDNSSRVKQIMDIYGCHMNVELQQRAVEFCTLFSRHGNLRPSLLEKMPPLTKNARTKRDEVDPLNGEGDLLNGNHESNVEGKAPISFSKSNKESNALLDLLDNNLDIISKTTSSSVVNTTNSSTAASTNNVLDLLSDLDLNASPSCSNLTNNATFDLLSGLSGVSMDPKSTTLSNSSASILNDLVTKPTIRSNGISVGKGLEIFDLPTSKGNESIPSITAYQKNGIKIDFAFEKSLKDSNTLLINLEAWNQNSTQITDFLFQAAVPKTFQLKILPPTSNILPPNASGSIRQVLEVLNPTKAQLKMKLRLSYSINGEMKQDQDDVKNIPPQVWQV